MKWSSVHVLLIVLILTLFDYRFKADSEIKQLNRYVTPSGIIGCVNDQVPCQTIEQYATQPEMYFADNTCFHFQPGNHQLNSSLKLTNLRNVVFKGLPDSSNMVINIFLGPFINITWEDCWCVQVISINFILPENYSFSIVFKQTQLIELHNISITANGHNTGCSAILSQRSGISIRDCKFIGIQGSFGAAIMMSESSATTNGNNTFANCTAYTGGSVYLSNSILTLNGTNVFMNSTASVPFLYNLYGLHFDNNIIDAMCNHGTENYPKIYFRIYAASAYGGAILCRNCTLKINDYSTFKNNTAEYGGAIAGVHGWISINDSTLFDGNSAHYEGGAMNLDDINLTISGNVSLVNNSAAMYGGALYISDTNISFNMDITSKVSEILVDESSFMVVFQQNKASRVGGAIESHANNILIFTGTVKFIENSALNGGAIGFLQNLPSRMILVQVLNISFIMNHANESGGALYFKDSQCMLGSKSPEQCFISVINRTSPYPNPILIFEHNSAGSAGSTIYGGHLSGITGLKYFIQYVMIN